ncbi:3-oxoacyl-ACP reductase [Actinomadura craniellae]|uniref:3-oxoacyl-ACP reductase n=1 Tax=Actinomadura craniellae TaxID=2231787 RepID=A0A365GWN9_9ACTN|nr:SDR family NAD(P)-dependent oxidoreductase [Actinomadura craniellae]RAY11192.1 3-oxoacyl-ACP reductase [Actinomadura craniellae]
MTEGRLAGKAAVVVGAGQTPGETIGNGRATALLFAREGARVLVVDRDGDSAAETCQMIADEGGTAVPLRADITDPEQCAALAAAAVERWGSIDVLHNNVGIGTGDADALSLTPAAWDRIHDVNLKAMWTVCREVIPHLRQAGGGSIVNVSSIASVCATPLFAYKISKAGVNALTHALAMENVKYGIRVNAILPGLIDTPMAIRGHSAARGIDPDELRVARDRLVPLRRRQGTAWDVAYAALYLASDEAGFVTAVALPVDGGQSARIG